MTNSILAHWISAQLSTTVSYRSFGFCPGRVVKDLTLRVIEWKPRVTARKIYFGGESGVVLGSLPANVTAPDFVFSAYAYTPFFNEIAEANLPEFDGLTDPDFARVLEYVRDTLTDYFRLRQAQQPLLCDGFAGRSDWHPQGALLGHWPDPGSREACGAS
jgi:hypothetical protein